MPPGLAKPVFAGGTEMLQRVEGAGGCMGRKHWAVCSLSFLPPLWWQTGFLPCFSTLAPSSFPLFYSQCGSQSCTAEVFRAWSFGQGTPGWVSQGLRNASEIPLHPSLTLFSGEEGGFLCQGWEALTWTCGLPGIASPLACDVKNRPQKIPQPSSV